MGKNGVRSANIRETGNTDTTSTSGILSRRRDRSKRLYESLYRDGFGSLTEEEVRERIKRDKAHSYSPIISKQTNFITADTETLQLLGTYQSLLFLKKTGANTPEIDVTIELLQKALYGKATSGLPDSIKTELSILQEKKEEIELENNKLAYQEQKLREQLIKINPEYQDELQEILEEKELIEDDPKDVIPVLEQLIKEATPIPVKETPQEGFMKKRLEGVF